MWMKTVTMSLRETVGLAAISLFLLTLPSLALAEEKIPVFPTTPVDVYTIYASLAVFWLAIIGLIVVIKMKLNEIERIQKLGIDKEDKNAPLLD
jgi:ABC-type proline/glycine betaine transport system permease subunit